MNMLANRRLARIVNIIEYLYIFKNSSSDTLTGIILIVIMFMDLVLFGDELNPLTGRT